MNCSDKNRICNQKDDTLNSVYLRFLATERVNLVEEHVRGSVLHFATVNVLKKKKKKKVKWVTGFISLSSMTTLYISIPTD